MNQTYTYEGGRKVVLTRLTSRFVSRARKEDLLLDDFRGINRLSQHSWSVRTNADRIDDDIRRARLLAPAYGYFVDADTGDDFLLTDRLFIRLRAGISAEELAVRWRLEVLKRFSWRDYLCRVDPKEDVIEMMRALSEQEHDRIESVDHDLNVRLQRNHFDIDKPLTRQQWYLFSSSSHRLVRKEALVHCTDAWTSGGFGSRDVVVGVIDCGCDLQDPNFADDQFSAWALLIDGELQTDAQLGWDKAAVMDATETHGTLCATLVAASANRAGGLGIAPGCRLLPVKWTLNSNLPFPKSLFAELVLFLKDKTSVVTSSWGLGYRTHWPDFIRDVIADSVFHGGPDGKGIIWIWSAGNTNTPIHHTSDTEVPIAVERDGPALIVRESARNFVRSLSQLPGVMHVGAVSSVGQRCHYSNYGTGLTLMAPSSNRALYGRISVAGRTLAAPLGGGRLHAMSGTSAAAPMVAGVAALVRSVNPNLGAMETISILKRTADKNLDMRPYPSSSRATDPGHNWDVSPVPPFHSGEFRDIGDPDGTWSPWFGFGAVNAQRAVIEGIKRKSTTHGRGHENRRGE